MATHFLAANSYFAHNAAVAWKHDGRVVCAGITGANHDLLKKLVKSHGRLIQALGRLPAMSAA